MKRFHISLHIDTKTNMSKNNPFQYLNGSSDNDDEIPVDDGFTSVKSSKKNRRGNREPVKQQSQQSQQVTSIPVADNWDDIPSNMAKEITPMVLVKDDDMQDTEVEILCKQAEIINLHNTGTPAATPAVTSSTSSLSSSSSSSPSSSSSEVSDLKFHSKWRYWTHEKYTQDWMINSFHKLIVLGTASEFWRVFNNFDKINGLEARYYFMMRGDIEPTWEHPRNRNGIIWSVQVPTTHIDAVWERLCALIVGETFVSADLNPKNARGELNMLVNGISTVLREVTANSKGGNGQKNTFYLIKIWLSRNVDILKHITAALKDISDLRDLSIRPMQLRPEY